MARWLKIHVALLHDNFKEISAFKTFRFYIFEEGRSLEAQESTHVEWAVKGLWKNKYWKQLCWEQSSKMQAAALGFARQAWVHILVP